MNERDALPDRRDEWHRTPVLLPDNDVETCWAAVGSTSEYEVARAIIRLVEATGMPGWHPLPIVVTLPHQDIVVLTPELGQVTERLAGIVAAKVAGCRVRIELRPGGGDWSVSLGSAKRVLPRTKEITAYAGHEPVRTVRFCLVAEPGHRRIMVPRNGIVLGRAQSGDGRVRDDNVSREHCRLDVGPGFLVVEDLNSRNGTWVSGTRIAVPTLLGLDDLLRLGRTEFRVGNA